MGIAGLFFPDLCPVCGRLLAQAEERICMACLADMPCSYFWGWRGNNAEQMFMEQELDIPAASLLLYRRESKWKSVVYDFKYNDNKQLGRYLSSMLGSRLNESGWGEMVDIIVPVPLHFIKEWKRGFNQAGVIAVQLGRALDKPVVETLLKRTRYTFTQTKKDKEHRKSAVAGAFRVNGGYGELIRRSRILLVDDVLTTGATLGSCARELLDAGCRSVSVATLAFVE